MVFFLVESSFGVNCTAEYVKTNRCRIIETRVVEKFLKKNPYQPSGKYPITSGYKPMVAYGIYPAAGCW